MEDKEMDDKEKKDKKAKKKLDELCKEGKNVLGQKVLKNKKHSISPKAHG